MTKSSDSKQLAVVHTPYINESNTMEEHTDVYVLMTDGDGTMRSIDEPFGVAVTSEAEAIKFVKNGGIGYTHSYMKVRIFENKDDAIEWAFK